MVLRSKFFLTTVLCVPNIHGMEHALPHARRVLRPNRQAVYPAPVWDVLMDGVRLGSVWQGDTRNVWSAKHVIDGYKSFHTTSEQSAVAICERAGWGPYAPAEKGDFRIEIDAWDEPELDCTHTVYFIDDRGFLMESFTTDDPHGAVEAARYCQTTPLEQRWAEDLEAGR